MEAVAASPSGRIVVAAAANRDDGSRVLHIARLNRGAWEWLGAPLVSTPEPFTHAQRPSIAFVGEQPVVAWSEERNAELAGLFVARWNGSSWTRLGVVTLDRNENDSYLTPAVAVDGRQQIWLAWTGYAAAYGSPAGTAVPGVMSGANRWKRLLPMILQRDAPLVAWSQTDPTDNHHLYVSTWAAGDVWTSQLSDLHLVEGVSNVMDVKLAAGDGPSFFVSWDEPGKDKRDTRMIQAYACAPGETPASPPASIVERDTWPTTVDEAARRLVAQLDDKSKELVRTTAKDQLIRFYDGWGRGIRNSFGLWRGNEKLLESCGRGKRTDPEACSMVIIEAAWTLLQAPAPRGRSRR